MQPAIRSHLAHNVFAVDGVPCLSAKASVRSQQTSLCTEFDILPCEHFTCFFGKKKKSKSVDDGYSYVFRNQNTIEKRSQFYISRTRHRQHCRLSSKIKRTSFYLLVLVARIHKPRSPASTNSFMIAVMICRPACVAFLPCCTGIHERLTCSFVSKICCMKGRVVRLFPKNLFLPFSRHVLRCCRRSVATLCKCQLVSGLGLPVAAPILPSVGHVLRG